MKAFIKIWPYLLLGVAHFSCGLSPAVHELSTDEAAEVVHESFYKGGWAYGHEPQTMTLWDEPELSESDHHARLSWPNNWPKSPISLMPFHVPYESRGRDPHFDCDDFAYTYHLWCKNNAGKTCWSISITHNVPYPNQTPDVVYESHVMSVHQIKTAFGSPRFCLIEYYDNTVYGCWTQKRDQSSPVVPDELLAKVGFFFNSSDVKQSSIRALPDTPTHDPTGSTVPPHVGGSGASPTGELAFTGYTQARHVFTKKTCLDPYTGKPASQDYLDRLASYDTSTLKFVSNHVDPVLCSLWKE